MNVKFQNWILKIVQNDPLVMPNLFRHLIFHRKNLEAA